MDNNILLQHQNPPEKGSDLSPYHQVIHGLAPLVNKAVFKAEFEQQTKKISPELRFLVKMEIKRLAKPCIRSIDLRTIVNDDCRLFQHHGIEHYLNINGILAFEKLVKRYGEYTFGVYEGVLEEAKKEREQFLQNRRLKQEGKGQSLVQNVSPDEKYIVPCQELLSFPTRKQERLNYVVAVEVFFADNSSVHASTLDISVNGLRIKLKDPEKLQKIKAFAPIQVVFRGLDKHAGLSREPIEYQVLSISGQQEKAFIHLYRDNSQNKKFGEFITHLVKVNKHRYKVNLDNVEMAMASKIYEQSFANNTPSLPVFVCKDEHGFYRAHYASMNANNKAILDYWTDENGQQLLGFMANPNRIYQLLNSNDAYPSMTIYCFNHIKDDKVYFYSASQEELARQPELATTFLSYGARKVSWRVFQVTCSDISPSDAYSPTSIPDGINKQVDRLNRALSPRLQANLASITHMLSITDITNEDALACYQKKPLYKHKVKLLKAFGHARNKPPLLLEACRHKQQELRRQLRYILRTQVIVSTKKQRITGVTEDISVGGLKVELDEAFIQRSSSKVTVSFPKLQELSRVAELKHLQYRVVHMNVDKQVLHLQAVADEEMNTAESFFSQLIESNQDKLPTVEKEESIPGINSALRNLHCKNSPQFCAYIEKKYQGYLPAAASVSATRAPWMDFLHHDKSLASVNLSWLYQDIENGKNFINQSLRVLKVEPKTIKTEIFVAAPAISDVSINIARAKWQYEFVSHREKIAFIKQALSSGQFFAFSVSINKALKPDTEKLEQELLYLSQHAVHKATYFEERMWDIAGGVFLNDISEEVLYRYQLKTQD